MLLLILYLIRRKTKLASQSFRLILRFNILPLLITRIVLHVFLMNFINMVELYLTLVCNLYNKIIVQIFQIKIIYKL